MSKLTKALTAAAGNAGSDPLYAEDVFSTYLYDGNGSSITVNNGIDLAGEGGVVWTKSRTDTNLHYLQSSETTGYLSSNNTNAIAGGNYLNFASDGYTFPYDFAGWNGSGRDYASWTFRKAEKFFDVVTYTGNGTAGRTVAHNLGSVPAVMIVKSTTNGAYGWRVYHQSLGNTDYLRLNETNAAAATAGMWNNTTPTDSEFTLGGASVTNGNGESFVAYLFASDAGGFGDDGDENIIKCGSYTGNATKGLQVNCGFEPQLIITKRADASGHGWMMYDTMRGFVSLDDSRGGGKQLLANSSNAEAEDQRYAPTSTGFELKSTGASVNANGGNYIYIAIRRPMKTPESGTEVFSPVLQNGGAFVTTGFPVDSFWNASTTLAGYASNVADRLRGGGNYLDTRSSAAEDVNATQYLKFDNNTGVTDGLFNPSYPRAYWSFKRATGFFDVVAYSGDGAATQDITHNLGVSPDFIVVKQRTNSATQWPQWASAVPNYSRYLNLTSGGFQTGGQPYYVGQSVSSTTFRVSTDGSPDQSNGSGKDYIAYLFATLAGVSKVGSYTGTGADLNVDCGFSAGARFILIKRTDSTGDWYTYDSARGIVAGNDPYLLLNSTAAEVTNTDYIDPLSSGFTVTSSAPAALNASGGTYIFLAIA